MNKNIENQLKEIKELLTTSKDEPLTIEKASLYLNCKKSYLYYLIFNGKIKHYKPNGKKVYFMKSDLNKWVLSKYNKEI